MAVDPRLYERMPKGRRYFWSATDVASLRRWADEGLPSRQIALRLGRSPKAVRTKAEHLGLSLANDGAERRRRTLDRNGGATPLKRRKVMVTADFDVSALSYEERLALAELLLASVPVDHRLQVVAASQEQERRSPRTAIVQSADAERPGDDRDDRDDDTDWRSLDAAQIRDRLGIPIAPPSPPPLPR